MSHDLDDIGSFLRSNRVREICDDFGDAPPSPSTFATWLDEYESGELQPQLGKGKSSKPKTTHLADSDDDDDVPRAMRKSSKRKKIHISDSDDDEEEEEEEEGYNAKGMNGRQKKVAAKPKLKVARSKTKSSKSVAKPNATKSLSLKSAAKPAAKPKKSAAATTTVANSPRRRSKRVPFPAIRDYNLDKMLEFSSKRSNCQNLMPGLDKKLPR